MGQHALGPRAAMNQSPPSPHAYAYPQAGEVLEGKYQIDKMLGEGGMGAVAKAMHLLRRAHVALKFMNPMYLSVPGAVERFRNEGVAASQIDSDHVVHIYDVGTLPSGAPYLVMEYLEGRDLADLLHREGRPGLPVERAVHFMLQILRGLQVAHGKGIVHRDMKPSNCFVVEKDGEPDFVKLLDFGISKVKSPGAASLTQTNSALGTPLYMSPEQAKSPRDVDARSDIYSVGVLLYELLSGKTPFFSESGELTEILFKLFTSDAPHIKTHRPDLPDALAAAVHRALARDVSARFQDVAQIAEALAPFAGPESAHVLSRIRSYGLAPGSRVASSMAGARVSLRPPAASGYGAPGTAADTHSPEVLAATMAHASGDTNAKPADDPAVRTDLGASRDATHGGVAPATKRRHAGALLAVAMGVVMLAIGGTVATFLVRAVLPRATPDLVNATTAPRETAPPLPTALPVPTPAVPTVRPSAEAAPSVTAAPSAAPDAGRPKNVTPRVVAPPAPAPRNPPCISTPSKPCAKIE